MSATEYDNPETVEQIEQAREEIGQGAMSDADDGGQLELPDLSPAEEHNARRELAREEATGRPDLREKATVEFRGHEFTFTELGDAELEAVDYADIDEEDIEAGTEAAEYVYRVLGRCGVGTDEAYWRQYSIQGSGDTDGVMDVFSRVVAAFNEDVDPDELDAAGNSPSPNEG